ncbi:MAG: tRNA-dihydrouridine synthase, partial [Clostridia bacterium]|nr:tRNA-dihydrouridine synthase [Clostridia bacterium]
MRLLFLKYQGVEWNGFAALAPMAGVADKAFREICVKFGAGYTVTEMVSAKGLCMQDRKSREL